VDAVGGPTIDPTANVIAIVEAATKRQDDLRIETNRRLDTEITHIKELLAHRLEHLKELRGAEAERVNAIRQVDVAGANTAAAQTLAAVQTLAANTSSTAAALANQIESVVKAIHDRLASLERSSYEGKGKEAVSDPVISQMASDMRDMREEQKLSTGKTQGVGMVWVVLLGAVSLISGLLGIGGVLYAVLRGGTP
jgi:hypothetical protein